MKTAEILLTLEEVNALAVQHAHPRLHTRFSTTKKVGDIANLCRRFLLMFHNDCAVFMVTAQVEEGKSATSANVASRISRTAGQRAASLALITSAAYFKKFLVVPRQPRAD